MPKEKQLKKMSYERIKQTFPDNYEFLGTKESVRKQIGMAVPPVLSEIIFTAILKTFAILKYESIEPNIKLW